MPTKNKSLGNRGEAIAAAYLEKCGYLIIDKNCRLGRHEIDIIARHDKDWVFIEIKTRRQNSDGFQENPLSFRQKNNLKLAIAAYCRKNRLKSEAVRLDLIFILTDKQERLATLKHYRDIF